MELLKYIINDSCLLENVVNAGKDSIIIKDSDGNDIEYINTFDKIMATYLNRTIFASRTPPPVRTWFNSNFTKWVKSGTPDRSDDMMDEKKFQDTFYVPLENYIKQLLQHERGLVAKNKLSREIILDSFPDFVKSNPKGAIVFSGGRLFRLKKITDSVEQLHEFLVAVVQNSTDRNDIILPPTFMVKRLDVLDVPQGFKRTLAWHRYTQQQAEKVTAEQAKQLIASLKQDTDYKVLEKYENGTFMVKLLSAKSADVEGTIMKHCITSYGRDIEQGKTTVYSLRNKFKVPVATIEMRGNKATQVKGPHNGMVNVDYRDTLRKFFKDNKISVGSDAKNFGGMKEKQDQDRNQK